jgi:4-amino-4-deoxy-L-arabinose transferase-like glycosyltransferase
VPRLRPVLTLLALSLLTFVLGLGRQAITDSDEAFYAEAAREMVESGDWLTPHFDYENRWEKPALYYWLSAATYRVAGPGELTARLWSALSGVGLVLLTWAIARRFEDAPSSAWLAGAIVATCYGYFAIARAALPDLPLAFCITLGIAAVLRAVDADPVSRPQRRWWALAGLAAGLGFLVKGPIALVVPALVLLPIWWRERRTVHVSPGGVFVATVVFALVGLPWYVMMTLEHGRAYLQSFFVGDNIERFATRRFNDPRTLLFYVPVVIGGMLPWSAYLVALVGTDLVDAVRGRRRPSKAEWRLLLWVAGPLLFFTASVGKQPRYILPILPPLAILLARMLAARLERGAAATGGEGLALRIATWISAATFAGLALLLFRARPIFIAAHPAATMIGVAALALSAGALAHLALTRAWRRVPVTMSAAAVTLLLSVQFGALAGVRPEAAEQMASLVFAHRHANEPVAEYQVFVRNLVYYTGFKHVRLFTEGNAVDFMRSPERVLLVVRASDLPALEAQVGTPLRPLGEVDYLNTANIRIPTLLFPDRARDVEKVLLVTNR